MKNLNTVDADARLEAFLAETPIAPSGDFSRRVCAALAEEMLDAKLAEMPIEPSADFAARVEAALGKKNTFAFPSLLRYPRAVAAGVVAASVACFCFLTMTAKPLNEQVACVLESDPELARLAVADDDFSLNEWLEASQLLTALNENSEHTADFFAYYEN